MGTIIHDHIIITMDDYDKEKLLLVETHLRDNFPDTSVGPIKSLTNAFVTFCITTSGSKLGFDTYNSYQEKINELKHFLEELKSDISWIYLTYGDTCDSPARIDSCSDGLKDSIDDRDFNMYN